MKKENITQEIQKNRLEERIRIPDILIDRSGGLEIAQNLATNISSIIKSSVQRMSDQTRHKD